MNKSVILGIGELVCSLLVYLFACMIVCMYICDVIKQNELELTNVESIKRKNIAVLCCFVKPSTPCVFG